MPLTILLLFRIVVSPRLTKTPHPRIFRPNSPGSRSPDPITVGDIGDIGENVATIFDEPEIPSLIRELEDTYYSHRRKRNRVHEKTQSGWKSANTGETGKGNRNGIDLHIPGLPSRIK